MQATVAATQLCSESKAQALAFILKCHKLDGFEVNLLSDVLAFADNAVTTDIMDMLRYTTVRVDRPGLVGQPRESYRSPVRMGFRVKRQCGTCGATVSSLRDVYPVPRDTTRYYTKCGGCHTVWCTDCGPPCRANAAACNDCYNAHPRHIPDGTSYVYDRRPKHMKRTRHE